jgi:hypothetical protein
MLEKLDQVGTPGGTKSMLHEFNDSLARSHEAQDLPFWEPVYRTFFGDLFDTMINHRDNDEAQHRGIDRVVMLKTTKAIRIDEKVRWKDYGDIALEYWSDYERRKPGWVCKSLDCDFIAYAIAPAGICYLLPTIQLQVAWNVKKDEWIANYRRVPSETMCPYTGRIWRTISVAIPPAVLFGNLLSAATARFEPISSAKEIKKQTAEKAE